ncbi:hypothetical protein MTR67_049104 [Solanum verrucosum]|uniref:Response regulatory domain-containing protein n=1 Tax=Solanum verrucosum TaxID=315347 RepID=A0AAF0V1U7_SOLVR|nr:hypothetical protein MTR67_049104 [Solanum verrucosum]
MDCEITGNVNVPSAYIGLRILLVDHDTTSLSNITTILEEHSFKVTAIEQATIALSILREQIDQFNLVMVDVNMPEMNYLEFIKSTQLIKDKPIILMSPEVTIEMVKEATTQGACLIFRKSSISSMKLKDVWKHVKNYNNKANEISQHYKANQVYVMDNTSCPKKVQDRKGKGIANCSETYQDQAIGSLIEKDELKRCSGEDVCAGLDYGIAHLLSKGIQNYQSQTQQASNVQPTITMNFNEERHFNVLDSGDLSANFNELFQGADIHQPSEVPFVASPSSNDDSLNRWDEWFNELLELDDFELKLC